MGITRLLAKKVTNYHDPNSIASRLRQRRVGPLMRMIDNVYCHKGSVDIVDIGGTKTYWNIMPHGYLQSRNVHITLVNLLGNCVIENDTVFEAVDGDGCCLQYPDFQFDIAHSNSVIEHVGDWGKMEAFAHEVKRVARYYFVQTPYYWFPIEPHALTPFFHWLPEPLRVKMILSMDLGNWPKQLNIVDAINIVRSAILLDHEMMLCLFGDSDNIVFERILLVPKSMIAMRFSC